MARKDVFNGVKAMGMGFNVFAQMVAEEIGIERTLALTTKAMEKMGTMQGKMMKEKAGIKTFDAKAAQTLMNNVIESFGYSIKTVEESPQRVVTKGIMCPMYAAAHELGMDNKTIETMCRAGVIRMMDASVKQLNPKLTARLVKFRSSPDDYCEEEIVLG